MEENIKDRLIIDNDGLEIAKQDHLDIKVFFSKAILFLVGAIIAFTIEVILIMILGAIFDSRITPRGIGWIFLPIIIGSAFAKFAPFVAADLPKFKQRLLDEITSLSKATRLVIAASFLWFFSVGLYVLLFDPYGYRISPQEMSRMLKVMLFPALILGIGCFIYKKFIVVPSSSEEIKRI